MMRANRSMILNILLDSVGEIYDESVPQSKLMTMDSGKTGENGGRKPGRSSLLSRPPESDRKMADRKMMAHGIFLSMFSVDFRPSVKHFAGRGDHCRPDCSLCFLSGLCGFIPGAE